jgi:serine/threonine-protein kinase
LTVVRGDRQEWKVGAELYSGGFGKIYEVVDDPGKVIKLVRKHPGAEREYLVAELSGVHNVVPLLDRGETDDRWALIMPRAERSLREQLSEWSGRGIHVSSAVPILIDIAKALVDLGGKGVVHRDLKPENVLLLNGNWCLTDFGIAKYAQAATGTYTWKEAKSQPYAAPEQWRGERVSSATDVYALGVMGYEMLAGTRPFPGPDFREQHLEGQPPSLSAPAPLAALLEQCLSKGPQSRPTPENLLSRLQRQASVAPVTGGLASLEDANRAEIARLAEQSRLASQAQNEAERRAALAQDSNRQLRRISASLLEEIRFAAPAVIQTSLGARVAGDRTAGWRLRLGLASLDFEPKAFLETAPPLHIDVIDWCTVTVTQPPKRSGYEGRSHVLWFCDAQERGVYRWYETACMDQPLMNKPLPAIDPFAIDPIGTQAREAVGQGIGTFQIAWPFTAVHPGEMDEFIGRWADWFAQASTGALALPSHMPERPVHGSWRSN